MTASNLTPTRAELDGILASRSGDLAVTPYPLLLLALAVEKKSAVLSLQRNQLQKEVVFEDGAPVDCRSNIATEMLGRFLVAARKITEEQQHLALSQSTSRGVPLGEVLVEQKLLSPSELYRMLQQNLGRKLLEPFSWKSGSYAISYDVPRVESPLRVKVPQLLVTGIMKVETQETADEAAAATAGKFLTLSGDPHFGLAEIRPSREQQRILDAARGAAALDDFRASSGIEGDDLNRILYAFLLLGIVTVSDFPVTLEETPAPAPAAPAPADVPFMMEAPAEPESPAAPVVRAASDEEVMAAYLGHKRKDAFDLLSVLESDGLLAAKHSFLRFADRFHPSKFEDEGMREKAQDVLLAAARAYAELADDERRAALVRHRERKREEAKAESSQSKKKMIDPEELWRNGRDLAVQSKYREALSYFEMAAECDAQNGTYAAEAIWCRFQLGTTPASNALATLKHVLRRDPQSGATHLYLGQIMAVMGQKIEGAAYIDRASKMMPGDDRPAEALKKLR